MEKKSNTESAASSDDESTTLYNLRRVNAKSYTEKRDAALNEYLAAASPLIAALKSEAKALRKIGPEIKPLLERTSAEFSVSDFDAPRVKKAIGDLLLCCRAGLRTLSENPRQIDKLIGLIASYTANHFISTSPATQLRWDRLEADCLLGRSKSFESITDQIETLKTCINEAISLAAERGVFTPASRGIGTMKQKEGMDFD